MQSMAMTRWFVKEYVRAPWLWHNKGDLKQKPGRWPLYLVGRMLLSCYLVVVCITVSTTGVITWRRRSLVGGQSHKYAPIIYSLNNQLTPSDCRTNSSRRHRDILFPTRLVLVEKLLTYFLTEKSRVRSLSEARVINVKGSIPEAMWLRLNFV